MKKHFFRMVMALSLACGAFAFTGCTDYEEDINAINDRIDQLETGQIASMDQQIKTMSEAIEAANGLIEGLQGSVGDLEAADEALKGQIETLNGEIDAINDDIVELNGKISDLETDLEAQIAAAVEELKAADDANASKIEQLASDLAAAKEELQGLIEAGDEANAAAIAELGEKVEGYYAELKSAIDAANTANEEEFDKIYAEITSLKDQFAEKTEELAALTGLVTELQGKVANLETLTAVIPELTEKVQNIEENYLSKAEAEGTYATIEAVLALRDALAEVEGRLESLESLDIADRLADLESKYEELAGVTIPGLIEDIQKAQTVADEALSAANAAQEFAENVLGDLNTLKEALGIYAEGGLEDKIEALEAMDKALQDKDVELAGLIEDLQSTMASEVAAIWAKIGEVQGTIGDALADLEETKLSKDEFADYFANELAAELEKTDGILNDAIAKAVKAAADNLQAQLDAVNKKIDEEIMPAIQDLTSRLEDVEDDIEGLENRIQSLVYVPEYNDGMASVYTYTINEVPVSDSMVVTATFKVTPAALAEYVVNQQYDQVLVNVIPVKTRAASAAAYTASAKEGTVKVTKGSGEGYVDIEVTVPVNPSQDVTLSAGQFAFSLYVASKDEVDAVVGEDGTVADMDAGTYISSEYVQTSDDDDTVIALDEAYVLYNEANGKVYPAGEDLESEVNDYERAWSVEEDKQFVTFYGDNDYDGEDDGSYTLHIKLNDKFYTLEEAARIFRADVADITPSYSGADTPVFYNKDGSDATYEGSDYFTVSPVDPYGASVKMAQTSGMTDIIGSYVQVNNSFDFTADSRFGEVNVLKNIGKYKVINLPITVTVDGVRRVDWTYDFALTHADDMENPTIANDKPIVQETSGLTFTVENLGEIDLASILAAAPVSTEVRLGETVMTEEDAPVLKFKDVNMVDEETGTMTVMVSNYSFDDETENAYHFKYTYHLDEYEVDCTFYFDLTLGVMPGDETINYNQLPRAINFMLPGSGEIDRIGVQDAYKRAFSILDNSGWFTGEEQFKSALETNETTKFTTYRDGNLIYDQAQITETTPVHTRFNVASAAEYTDGTSFVRVSSSQITAKGNVFDFITEVTTWYGVTYTFTNEGVVNDPQYELAYIPTHIYGHDGDDPYVQLDYTLTGNTYVVDEAHPANYFKVAGIPSDFNGVLKVRFDTLTEPATGYENIPVLETLDVDNADGSLESEYKIDWSTYTARDLKIKAVLVAAAAEGETEVEVNDLDLTFKVYPLVESFAAKTEGDKAYDDADVVTDTYDNEEYIEILRPDNGDITINLWEYLKATARFSNGENFIPMENTSGVRHTSIEYVNANTAMTMYRAEIEFDSDYSALSGGQNRLLRGYDANEGKLTYYAEDGEIANPIYFKVKATLYYYLDYNDVPGVIRVEENGEEVIGAREVTLRIKLQDE